MFGKRIKELRKKKGLTQEQFADDFGVSTGTVAMWETDKRKPTYDGLTKLCEYFAVTLDELTGNPEIQPVNLFENVDFLDSLPESADWKYKFYKYLQLDEYGQDAVNALLFSEANRCEKQGTLRSTNNYFVDVRIAPEPDEYSTSTPEEDFK